MQVNEPGITKTFGDELEPGQGGLCEILRDI